MSKVREFGDNIRLEVRGRVRENFDRAMDIAFTMHAKATHYTTNTKSGLVLYWTNTDHDAVLPLPYEMNCEQAKTFVWGWLENQWAESDKNMEEEPDHDGSNGKGFHIHTGDLWGHVDGKWQAWLAIKPEWIWFGK